MKKIFFVICCISLVFGCKKDIPKDVIAPERMEQILYDMHIAEGYLATIPSTDSVKKVAASFYKGIYKKFGTDSAEYQRSLNYYYKQPEIFSPIYKRVLAELEKNKHKALEIK